MAGNLRWQELLAQMRQDELLRGLAPMDTEPRLSPLSRVQGRERDETRGQRVADTNAAENETEWSARRFRNDAFGGSAMPQLGVDFDSDGNYRIMRMPAIPSMQDLILNGLQRPKEEWY